jgi:hypothetical protein
VLTGVDVVPIVGENRVIEFWRRLIDRKRR